MIAALRPVLARYPQVAFALLFGSSARGTAHAHSDVDVAIGMADGHKLALDDMGALMASLEDAVRMPVHLVLLEEAPPGLAYRIFRDGEAILVRDRAALAARRARAVLEYLDFQPVAELCTRGVLAARHGR